MKLTTITILGMMALLLSCGNEPALVDLPDTYQLRFELGQDHDEIAVTSTYRSSHCKDTLTLLLPTNFDRKTLENTLMIEDLTLQSAGQLVMVGIDSCQIIGAGDSITLTYTIPSYEGHREYLSCEGDDYFIPAVSPRYFHFYGDKSMVLPILSGEEARPFDVRLDWINFPKDWSLANDFGEVQTQNGYRTSQEGAGLTSDKMGQTLFFGGEFRKAVFSHQDLTFQTYFFGDVQIEDEVLVDGLQKVIVAEMDLWQHFTHRKDYVICIMQKGADCGKITGRNMYDSFSFYMSGHFTEEYVPILFARGFTHEFTHTWIGGDLAYNNPQWENMNWFMEGFTEYYAIRINQRAGLITDREARVILNELIQQYLLSPYAQSTMDQFVAGRAGDQRLEKLAYEKGAVFAFYLDGQFREQTDGQSNLDDFMKEVLSLESRANFNGNLSPEVLHQIAQDSFGVALNHLIERHIMQGELIPIVSPVIDSLSTVDQYTFDYGFEFQQSMETEVVTGVNPDSEAYANGLRDGQKVLAVLNFTDDPTGVIELLVESEGVELKVAYPPQGALVSVPVIEEMEGW